MSQGSAISVIVAAYNAERYLRRSLDSIQAQTFNDFDVIIVDDGSTDNTPAIADEYAAKDARFKVIHKPNGGVASARQAGLDAATGEYTIHVDSDDWVDPEMLEEMYGAAKIANADMLICDYYEVYPEKAVYNIQKPNPADRLSVFGQMLNNLSGALWNKLIRKDMYSRYGIHFDPSICDEEDKLICLKLLSHDISVSYLGKAFYHYDHCLNTGSLTKKKYAVYPRLKILETTSSTCDLTPVQLYFDNAVFYIAYQGLFVTEKEEKSYFNMFHKYRKNFLRADYPLHNKILIFLRLCGLKVPVRYLKDHYGQA